MRWGATLGASHSFWSVPWEQKEWDGDPVGAESTSYFFTAARGPTRRGTNRHVRKNMSEHSAYEHEGGSVVVKEVPVIKVRAWR